MGISPIITSNSPTTSPSVKPLKPPLNTLRLRPSLKRIEIKTGVRGAILESGDVEFEFDISKKTSGKKSVERVTVSSDGKKIRVERRPENGNFTGEYQVRKYLKAEILFIWCLLRSHVQT